MRGKQLRRTTISLSEDADKALNALEVATGVCRSDLINLAILFYAAVFLNNEGRAYWEIVRHVQRAWRHQK